MDPINADRSDDHESVRQANDRFYRALEAQDLEAMEEAWIHAPFAHCVHPQSDVFVGWEAVRASWVKVFAATRWMRVTPTADRIEIMGTVAIVTCAENITVQTSDDVTVAVASATNLFLRTRDGWRLFHHHASLVPVQVTHPFTGTIQ
jgi:ketosteroid isomerase-like protein